MNILKQILNYFIWISISLLLGIGYMWFVLGSRSVESTGFWYLLDIIYNLVLYHVGLRVGVIIAVLFILVDVFCLKKKLKTNSKKVSIRFMSLIMIAMVVVVTHYILEKVVDII